MLLLGIDLGTSAVKASVLDAATGQLLATAQYPEAEAPIMALQPGWAEQQPDDWWQYTCAAIRQLTASGTFSAHDIGAIGIAYQMHGLVLTDKEGNVLRPGIIWCDSRAIPYGEAAFESIGRDTCLSCLLNAPGNFTAAKLAWVQEHEPDTYARIDKVLLPGDFLAYRFTGKATTSPSALSEGIFWDFSTDQISEAVTGHFGYPAIFFPELRPVFGEHGHLLPAVANELGLRAGIPVTYKAGDQPNNALSLNVLEPGEVAATAGTSGVIYAVTDLLQADPQSRINSFAHVNHSREQKRVGQLLCINGAGIANSWMRKVGAPNTSFAELNGLAGTVTPGSEGLFMLPFGNGAERVLGNHMPGASLHGLQFPIHGPAHLARAAQEGVAFAFRYGLDVIRENGQQPSVIRAGRANMFLSPLFTQAFVDATGLPVELYETDGSRGAALGAGLGAGAYRSREEAFRYLKPLGRIEPTTNSPYPELYEEWKKILDRSLSDDR